MTGKQVCLFLKRNGCGSNICTQKWNPGKCKQGLRPAVLWCMVEFDPHPNERFGLVPPGSSRHRTGPGLGYGGHGDDCGGAPAMGGIVVRVDSGERMLFSFGCSWFFNLVRQVKLYY